MNAGLYPHIPDEDYHADNLSGPPTLSSSVAKLLVTASPLHAYHAHPRLGGGRADDPTAAMDNGALMHRLLLGTGPALVRVDADDWRTKAAKEAREAARLDGKLAVLAEKMDAATARVSRVSEILINQWGIALDGEPEVTAVWRERGTWCRGRLDHWSAPVIYDLKFTECASPDAFARSAYNLGYDIQAAAYVSAVEAIRPDLAGRVQYKWIVVEESPDIVQVYTLSGPLREMGQRRWKRAVDLWTACLAANKWPAYADAEIALEPPAWALSKDIGAQMNALEGGSSGITF